MTVDPVFIRNPKEAERLSGKHVAFVGCGSGGSALALMASKSGVGRFTLIDPDVLSLENVGRHILARRYVGTPKVQGLKAEILDLNPQAEVEAVFGRFHDLPEKPDLLIAGTDSFTCEAKVNSYSLNAHVPAVYCGCWGEASVGEILYVVPGKTACYQCYAGFRETTVQVPEIPADIRKYTEPDFDATKVPGQAGLWANILMIAGLGFQIALALLDAESDRSHVIDYERTLLLFNISNYGSPLQPLAVTFGKVKRGCNICRETVELHTSSTLAALADTIAAMVPEQQEPAAAGIPSLE